MEQHTDEVEKYVYLIRHGQSEQNTLNVFQGASTELTELGRKQASFVADRARGLDAEVILASPMPRARETAQIIADATGLPLEVHDLLREYVPPSSLIGKPLNDPEGERYVREMLIHLHDPGWHFGDEDSYFDLHDRALHTLDFLVKRPETKIIVVSHAGFMRVLVTAMMTEGLPDSMLALRLMRFLKPMNTGITICRYRSHSNRRNKWRLVAWNDHAHLAETEHEEPM